MSGTKDFYAILGVPRSATAAEIRSRFHELALQYHPDRHANNPLAQLAEEKFKEIQEAYSVLSDEQKRKAYDSGHPEGQTYSHYSGSYESLITEAQTHCTNRVWPRALELCNRAIDSNPNRFEAYAMKGFIHLETNQNTDSQRMFYTAIQKGANEGEIFNGYGLSFLNNGGYREAVTCFERAITRDGEIPTYIANLAIAYENMNDRSSATVYWNKLQAIDPSHPTLQMRTQIAAQKNTENCQLGACACLILEHIFDCC